MKQFMDDNFLLETSTARRLFHDCAAQQPICDYHCHLSPKEIYENKAPSDLAELWLSGDHYKWRAMRAYGFSEDYCTGDKSGKEKFIAFAQTLEAAIGNPLYHWAHLELQRYFHIFTPLNRETAGQVWEEARIIMAKKDFSPRRLIAKSKVTVLCTTDDPADDLRYHKLLAEDPSFQTRVLPTFRPDKALNITDPGFSGYLQALSEAAGITINTPDDVITALEKRADYFDSIGCRVADHSFAYVPYTLADNDVIAEAFNDALDGVRLSQEEIDAYQTKIMLALGRKYASLGWAMELHMGALRNNSSRMFASLGADTGFDSMGDEQIARPLAAFLNALDATEELPKTVLFNLNAKDNCVLAAMAGNFQTGGNGQCKIQFGPAWWFLDTLDGMTEQMKQLASTGLLGKFIGMETDSRSFTSYARHEYFRRILCNLLGNWTESGMFENNMPLLKEMTENICYQNAMKYFNF